MAFEDADTLSYVLARTYSPDFIQATSLSHLIMKWEHHRQDRVVKMTDLTRQSGRLRKSSTYVCKKVAREWIIWAALKIRDRREVVRGYFRIFLKMYLWQSRCEV